MALPKGEHIYCTLDLQTTDLSLTPTLIPPDSSQTGPETPNPKPFLHSIACEVVLPAAQSAFLPGC